jgi:hypothetical protein
LLMRCCLYGTVIITRQLYCINIGVTRAISSPIFPLRRRSRRGSRKSDFESGAFAFTLADGDVSQRFAVPALNRQRTHVEARSNDNRNTFGASRASVIGVVQTIGDCIACRQVVATLALCKFFTSPTSRYVFGASGPHRLIEQFLQSRADLLCRFARGIRKSLIGRFR